MRLEAATAASELAEGQDSESPIEPAIAIQPEPTLEGIDDAPAANDSYEEGAPNGQGSTSRTSTQPTAPAGLNDEPVAKRRDRRGAGLARRSRAGAAARATSPKPEPAAEPKRGRRLAERLGARRERLRFGDLRGRGLRRQTELKPLAPLPASGALGARRVPTRSMRTTMSMPSTRSMPSCSRSSRKRPRSCCRSSQRACATGCRSRRTRRAPTAACARCTR